MLTRILLFLFAREAAVSFLLAALYNTLSDGKRNDELLSGIYSEWFRPCAFVHALGFNTCIIGILNPPIRTLMFWP